MLNDAARNPDAADALRNDAISYRVSAHIAPWLAVPDGTDAVRYYKEAFGAAESDRLEDEPGRVVVAQLAIDGARFWVQHDPESSPAALGGRSPIRMILTVADPDAVFARAIAAGASEVAPVTEGHGWRVGRIANPCGHHWEIGKPLSP